LKQQEKDMTLRILIVEDDRTSRVVMSGMLKPYGECSIAVNGKEAVRIFTETLEQGKRFDLVCLDIMMPEMDGQEALKQIREVESQNGIFGLDGVKIMMTTALADSSSLLTAFREQCESYIVKPITKKKLLEQLRYLGLVLRQ
jgi:two-component system chemotaxis response regulator CheY